VRFHQLTRTLREQCPWDIEQTHDSLVPYLLEEAYEVVDAIHALDADQADEATTETEAAAEAAAVHSADTDLIEELGEHGGTQLRQSGSRDDCDRRRCLAVPR